MNRTGRLGLLAATLLLPLSLAACGGSAEQDPVPAPSPTATSSATDTPTTAPPTPSPTSPAVDPQVKKNNAQGEDYSYTHPTGWTKSVAPTGNEQLGAATVYKSKSRESESVIVAPGGTFPAPDSKQATAQIKKELQSAGFKVLAFPAAVSLDGTKAAVVVSSLPVGAKTFYSRQYYALHDGQAYVLTVGTFSQAAGKTYGDQMVKTWRWK